MTSGESEKMYAHHVPHTYSTLTPNKPIPQNREDSGGLYVRPTGFEPATFRVGVD